MLVFSKKAWKIATIVITITLILTIFLSIDFSAFFVGGQKEMVVYIERATSQMPVLYNVLSFLTVIFSYSLILSGAGSIIATPGLIREYFKNKKNGVDDVRPMKTLRTVTNRYIGT